MAGLVPAIHVFTLAPKTWMPGTKFTLGPPKADPGAGHDGKNQSVQLFG
jgi:hypothetical protein